MTAQSDHATPTSSEALRLKSVQVAWLAAAVFTVSRRALEPSCAYAVGVLVGAPLWGAAGDHVGHGRVLILGLVRYVASSLLLLVPTFTAVWGMYALRVRRFAWLGSLTTHSGGYHGWARCRRRAWPDIRLVRGWLALWCVCPEKFRLACTTVFGLDSHTDFAARCMVGHSHPIYT